jgi:hypothetical protein
VILEPGKNVYRAEKKKTTSYGIEKMYSLYIFPPELHTLMTSLF